MAKVSRLKLTSIDFDIGTGAIIPTTQEAFTVEGHDKKLRVDGKDALAIFKKAFLEDLESQLKATAGFPTDKEAFVFILQFFASQKEYEKRDVDNMAKTVLDVLKNRIYQDDSQVRTLLVGKKMADKRVDQNFAYIAIKILNNDREVDALQISGLERAVTLFQSLRSEGI